MYEFYYVSSLFVYLCVFDNNILTLVTRVQWFHISVNTSSLQWNNHVSVFFYLHMIYSTGWNCRSKICYLGLSYLRLLSLSSQGFTVSGFNPSIRSGHLRLHPILPAQAGLHVVQGSPNLLTKGPVQYPSDSWGARLPPPGAALLFKYKWRGRKGVFSLTLGGKVCSDRQIGTELVQVIWGPGPWMR